MVAADRGVQLTSNQQHMYHYIISVYDPFQTSKRTVPTLVAPVHEQLEISFGEPAPAVRRPIEKGQRRASGNVETGRKTC